MLFRSIAQDGAGPRAHTVALVALVLAHPLQALHCRSAQQPWWRLPSNGLAWAALVALGIVQWIAVSWTPLAALLGSVPLGVADWLVVAVAAAWPIVLLEMLKAWRAR